MIMHWKLDAHDEPACGALGGDDHAMTRSPTSTPITCPECVALYERRDQVDGADVKVVMAPQFNWRLDEPFVTLAIGDGTPIALHPDVARTIGLALIQNAEWAVCDAMLIRVLHHGIGMEPGPAAATATALRQQAIAQGKGEVEKVTPAALVLPIASRKGSH